MSSLLRRAANGIGNFPKNSNLQGCNIAKTGASAILQCSFSGSDNVKFRRGAGRPFQRSALLGSCSQTTGQRPCLACRLVRCFCRLKPAEVATGDPHPPRRAQNLLAGCIFDRLACQKCFCVTLDKSNRTPADAG